MNMKAPIGKWSRTHAWETHQTHRATRVFGEETQSETSALLGEASSGRIRNETDRSRVGTTD